VSDFTNYEHQADGKRRPHPWEEGGFQKQFRVLGENLSWEEADAYALVLAAVSIEYRFRRSGWGWSLEVPAAMGDRAWTEIRRFQDENPPAQEIHEPLATASSSISGMVTALMLLSFHLATTRHGVHEGFILQGGASAEQILQGEYWRTVTALTLHGDAKHLAGNMLAIAVFGTLLCKRIGYGAAWLLILLAGAGGNMLNALLHQSQHLSIGASTAVFGAVGLLGGVKIHHGVNAARSKKALFRRDGIRAWLLPLGAALGLLAMLGSDVQTDVGAHLFGCLCGLILGSLYAFRFSRLVDEGPQLLLLLASLALLAGCWWRVGVLF